MAVAGLAGTAISAMGVRNQAEANAQAAAYQAQVAQNNAMIERQNEAWAGQAGAAKEAIQGMKNRAEVGTIKAKQGAAGIDVNTGSAAQVTTAAKELGVLDTATTRSNSAREAYGYAVAATGDVAQSQLLQTEAKNYQESATPAALGTFLSGASSVGSNWFKLQNVS